MIRLYSGSGSQEIKVLNETVPAPVWAVQKRNVVRLLEAKAQRQAASILQKTPFELHNGTNGFGDEFCILYYRAPMDRYVALAEEHEKRDTRSAYRIIADVVGE